MSGASLPADRGVTRLAAAVFGVLVLVGGFMAVIVGMLYKIVPFLVWLHRRIAARDAWWRRTR